MGRTMSMYRIVIATSNNNYDIAELRTFNIKGKTKQEAVDIALFHCAKTWSSVQCLSAEKLEFPEPASMSIRSNKYTRVSNPLLLRNIPTYVAPESPNIALSEESMLEDGSMFEVKILEWCWSNVLDKHIFVGRNLSTDSIVYVDHVWQLVK